MYGESSDSPALFKDNCMKLVSYGISGCSSCPYLMITDVSEGIYSCSKLDQGIGQIMADEFILEECPLEDYVES
jgi:hypothetical protein